MELRKWQQEALDKYRKQNPRDFTVTATPGAGKTTFAITMAMKLKAAGRITKVIVVCPTDHLRKQWSAAAAEKGLFLDPSLTNSQGLIPVDFDGYVCTYAQVGMKPEIHARRLQKHKVLVIFDEIHHAGDGLSWGEGLRVAFSQADRRLSLTGTPFRTGNEIIPFVRYEPDIDGSNVSQTDYAYGYKEALEDNVVRPVSFVTFSGTASWVNSAGQALEATLGEPMTKAHEKEAWRTVLNPRGVWINQVISAAHKRLTQLRSSSMPNAAGMILASNKEAARSYAKTLEKISGVVPTVILSDDRKASKLIEDFSNSTSPADQWIVAVRMVSEGVDVPRLAVGVWATSYQTSLFFAQAVGRFIRKKGAGETATVFLPTVKPLLYLASSMEAQRNHAVTVGDPEESDVIREPVDRSEGGKLEALSSTSEFGQIVYNGKTYDLSDLMQEEFDFLGLPGLLTPDQIKSLLDLRPKEDGAEEQEETPEEPERNPFEITKVRQDINKAVSRASLSTGVAHARLHKQIRVAVPGPPMPEASLELLKRRRQWVMENL